MKKIHFLKPLLKKIDKYLLGFQDVDDIKPTKVQDKANAEKEEPIIKAIN